MQYNTAAVFAYILLYGCVYTEHMITLSLPFSASYFICKTKIKDIHKIQVCVYINVH